MEQWKPIQGFEGMYEVSSLGNIQSLSRYTELKSGKVRLVKGRKLRPKNVNRYRSVALYSFGKRHELYVHRLVAMAFILKPNGKDYVNHIDGNPSNNNVLNLEWLTHSENVKHGYDSGLYQTKGKQKIEIEGKTVENQPLFNQFHNESNNYKKRNK